MDGSLLLSPKHTRARSKPNLSASEMQYTQAVHALLVANPPLVHLKAKLGPQLAQHPKQVTPGHLVSLEKLWYGLINCGCQSLVLQSQKIRSALHTLVSENSSLIADGTHVLKIPVIIDQVKSHIMESACMMKAMKNQGMPGTSKAISDLASSLKHKMVGMRMQVLSPILGLMQHSAAVMNEPSMPCPLSPPLPWPIPKLPPSRF